MVGTYALYFVNLLIPNFLSLAFSHMLLKGVFVLPVERALCLPVERACVCLVARAWVCLQKWLEFALWKGVDTLICDYTTSLGIYTYRHAYMYKGGNLSHYATFLGPLPQVWELRYCLCRAAVPHPSAARASTAPQCRTLHLRSCGSAALFAALLLPYSLFIMHFR